jgi:hypothetical protein
MSHDILHFSRYTRTMVRVYDLQWSFITRHPKHHEYFVHAHGIENALMKGLYTSVNTYIACLVYSGNDITSSVIECLVFSGNDITSSEINSRMVPCSNSTQPHFQRAPERLLAPEQRTLLPLNLTFNAHQIVC